MLRLKKRTYLLIEEKSQNYLFNTIQFIWSTTFLDDIYFSMNVLSVNLRDDAAKTRHISGEGSPRANIHPSIDLYISAFSETWHPKQNHQIRWWYIWQMLIIVMIVILLLTVLGLNSLRRFEARNMIIRMCTHNSTASIYPL